MRTGLRVVLALVTFSILFNTGSRRLFAQDPDAPKGARDADKIDTSKGEEESEGKENEFIRKRMEWFHDQRAFPNKTIPRGIRQAGIKERDRKVELEEDLRQAIAGATPETTPAEPVWTLIGPKPISVSYYGSIDAGRVTAIAIDPANPKIIYMGGAEGGVWKTVNSGETWTPLTDSQPSLAVGSITIDPNNTNTIYVGTGEENFSGDSYYGAGILKSTNGGETWTQSSSAFGDVPCGGEWVGAIAVQPTNSQTLLAAVEPCYYGASSIFRSTDGGKTWTSVYRNKNGWVPATAMIFDRKNANVVYAATAYGGILKSTNAGLTWNPANGSGNNALPTASLGRAALAMAPSNPSTLYVAIANSSNTTENGNLLGMWKSTDGGNNWTLLQNTPDFCSTQCWYDIVLAVSPTNPNFVVAGGVYPYHPGGSAVVTSLDGGTTWVDQSPQLHPDTHALAFTPDGSTLYTGSDGGVWSTTNPSASTINWTSLNGTLAITEFYPGISMDQNNVNHTYIGTQDNGTQKYSGSLGWPVVACGDGGSTLIDYAVTSTVYTNCIEQSFIRSPDDGNTWYDATTGLDSYDRTAWVPPTAIDPQHHETLYFGTYRVYQSTNEGALWTPISGDLGNPLNKNDDGVLNAIAVAHTDPNTIYVGSDDGEVAVTRNGLSKTGATWTKTAGPSLPYRSVSWIAVDPTAASTAYVGFSGFTGFGDKLGHIFKTSNAGATWADVSGDLPNTPVDAILVDPDAPETIFIGTDIGAFYTTSGGTSWTRLGTGLPNVVVTGLGLHENSRTLRASTHGRSVWDLNIATLLPVPTIDSLSPTVATADSAGFTLTVEGVQFNSKSVVIWNGTPLATTFVNSGQITAKVLSANLLKGGAFPVYVMNGAGGKLSNPGSITVDNPAPKLTLLSKTKILAGSAGFTLTVTGTGFDESSKIVWKGVALTATFASQSSLSTAIPAAYIALAGTVPVTVENPAPGGGTTAALTFTIDNPVPVATALSPNSAKIGGAAFTLTVTGSNFERYSRVEWNGVALATTYSSATKLTATVPAADIAKATIATVAVVNSVPGGGTSAGIKFAVK